MAQYITHEQAERVGAGIARFDFCVVISRRVGHQGNPWIITVSLPGRQRHVVVEATATDDVSNPSLALLGPNQSVLSPSQFGFNPADVESRIDTRDLLASGYNGIFTHLFESESSLAT